MISQLSIFESAFNMYFSIHIFKTMQIFFKSMEHFMVMFSKSIIKEVVYRNCDGCKLRLLLLLFSFRNT